MIKLTRSDTHTPIHINPNYIVCIEDSHAHTGSRITVQWGREINSILVNETSQDILCMIT